MASRAQSSFRAQSEWDTPKDQKRSEWDAGGGAGRKSSVKGGGNANGLTGPAQVQAKKLKQKFKQLATSKARGGKPDYKAVFKVFDPEGSGQINRLEFKRGLEMLDFEVPRDQMQQLQRFYFDGDGDNLINFTDFCAKAVDDNEDTRRKQWEEEDTWDAIDYLTLGFFR